jgi:hypothetical protein
MVGGVQVIVALVMPTLVAVTSVGSKHVGESVTLMSSMAR